MQVVREADVDGIDVVACEQLRVVPVCRLGTESARMLSRPRFVEVARRDHLERGGSCV
jgi:hypothetical protein